MTAAAPTPKDRTSGTAAVRAALAVDNPYIGLRPYSEHERGLFFGRDRDCRIFVDMVLANRLTLLFAASGVGKSSLLQAAVLPRIKDPAQENLDAVYCNNWAGDPLRSIRLAAIQSLTISGRIAPDSLSPDLCPESLLGFFEILSHFVRQPLVVVLDQFEEFFRYHRASPAFPTYRNQLVELIVDRSVPLSLVLSMREDFALSLNAFKPEIPTVLFNNYYRLEKLPRSEAEDAIRRPADHVGYCYEPALLTQLIIDLAAREQSRGAPLSESAEYVEPPYLQIICSQLFELDRNDPQRMLRLSTYQRMAGARGLLSRYVGHVTAKLSSTRERRIASRCFSFLITRHGTKVAHTVDSLARELREPASRVATVLEKLETARLLRRQSQDDVTWYELYHDLFSDSVEEWNERFKSKQRLRRGVLGGITILCGIITLYAAYDIFINHRNYHLRLSVQSGLQGQVEIYQGKVGSSDLFGLQRYYAETGITRQNMEPDQLFAERPLIGLTNFDREWSDRLHGDSRLQFLRTHGELDEFLLGVRERLTATASDHAWDALGSISALRINQRYDTLQLALDSPNRSAILDAFFSLYRAQRIETSGTLWRRTQRVGTRRLLEQDDWRFVELVRTIMRTRHSSKVGDAAGVLTLLEGNAAIPDLVALLATAPENAHETIKEALLDLDSQEVVDAIETHLRRQRNSSKPDGKATIRWLDVLARSRSVPARASLSRLIAEDDAFIRMEVLTALYGQVGNGDLVEQFLADSKVEVAQAAAKALSFPASDVALGQMRALSARVDDKTASGKLSEIFGRVDPRLPAAERRFAKSLARLISRQNQGEDCRERQVLWNQLEASPLVLTEVIKNVDSSARRYLLNCTPSEVLIKNLAELQALALSPAQSSQVAREIVRRIYRERPDAAFRVLQQMLDGADQPRHTIAIGLIRELRTEHAYALLTRLIANPAASSETQLSALRAFGSGSTFDIHPGSEHQIIVHALRRAARKEDYPEFRIAAAVALAEWMGEDAQPDLQRLLQDHDKEVHRAAMLALTELRTPYAMALITPMDPAIEPRGERDEEQEPDLPDQLLTRVPLKEKQLKDRLRTRRGSGRDEWQREIEKRLNRLAQIASCEQSRDWLQAASDSGDEKVQQHVATAIRQIGEVGCRQFAEAACKGLSEQPHASMLGALAMLARASDLPLIRQEYSKITSPAWSGSVDWILAEVAAPLHYELVEPQGRGRWMWRSEPEGYPSAPWLIHTSEDQRDWIWWMLNMPELGTRKQVMAISLRMQNRLLRRMKDADSERVGTWSKSVQYLDPEHSNAVLLKHLNSVDAASVKDITEVFQPSIRTLISAQQRAAIPLLLKLGGADGLGPELRGVLAWLDPPRFATTERRWWPILAARCEPKYLEKLQTLRHLTTSQRQAMAQLLGKREEPCSARLLTQLGRDAAVSVRQAAAEALGQLEQRPQEAELRRLLEDRSVTVQREAGKSLAKQATSASIPKLAERALDDNTPLYVVVPLLYALGHAGGSEAAQKLLTAARKYQGTVARHAYRALGDMRAEFVVGELLSHLGIFEEQMRSWRQHRDRRETEADGQARTDGERGKATTTSNQMPRPDTHAMAELAMTLGRIAPSETAFRLLHHDLADVRLSVALGLAVRMDPALIRSLDEERAKSKDPLFRHAAYRSIDMSLDLLELLANEKEIHALQELEKSQRIHDQAGVLARITWTLDMLVPERRAVGAQGAQR